MKKISQGKYEIFATKAEAIRRFRQLQGVCMEKYSNETVIEFYCFKNGKMMITDPPSRTIGNECSTHLSAKILEQDGKTYVSYYTAYSQSNHALKWIAFVIFLLMIVYSFAHTVIGENKTYYLPILAVFLILCGRYLFDTTAEKTDSTKDSELLIKELEKRVEAVNLWDK